jgi:hypothetical protein
MSRKTRPSPAELLADEFRQEKASALGRLGRALEASLAALARFEASHPQAASTAGRQLRAKLVAEASVALWHFVVQREACGLRDLRYVLRDYRDPARWPRAWARCRKRCSSLARLSASRRTSPGGCAALELPRSPRRYRRAWRMTEADASAAESRYDSYSKSILPKGFIERERA